MWCHVMAPGTLQTHSSKFGNHAQHKQIVTECKVNIIYICICFFSFYLSQQICTTTVYLSCEDWIFISFYALPHSCESTWTISYTNNGSKSQKQKKEQTMHSVWVSEVPILSLRIPILNLKNAMFESQKYLFWASEYPFWISKNTVFESHRYPFWVSEYPFLNLRIPIFESQNAMFESQKYPFWVSEYPFWISKMLCLSLRNTHFESQNTVFESQRYPFSVSEILSLSLRNT